jgi:bifunctional ADP-heptose synthase (sugar kinase/adenylyltransferase)
MKKNARKHTHIPKPKKVTKSHLKVNVKAEKLGNKISDSMKNMNKILSDSEKKKVENINKMYDILQEQMEEYLVNLEERTANQEKEEIKLTPDEKIKEFSDMLSIFVKFESLTRKLESHL